MQNISSQTPVFTQGVPTCLAFGQRDTGKHSHGTRETESQHEGVDLQATYRSRAIKEIHSTKMLVKGTSTVEYTIHHQPMNMF